jgi:deoxyribodipyrimidine photo-lyase
MLSAAVADADEVIPFYCFDRHYNQKMAGGFPKTGNYRRTFLNESLMALQAELRARGGDLLFKEGVSTADAITEIHAQCPIDVIYCQDLPFFEEQEIYSRVEELGIPIKCFWQCTLFDLEDLPFDISKMPWIFTNFRKKVEKYAQVRELIDAPESLVVAADLDYESIEPGGKEEVYSSSQPAGITYAGGEEEAWRRLRQYIWEEDRLKEYKQTRNGMLGADYSSKFSAALAHGCLSPVQIYHEAKHYERERIKNSSTYWLVFELIWRDFFRFTALAEGERFFRIKRDSEVQWTEAHERWRMGQTGQSLIDACMNELRETGYLGNRGRQLVASYLVHDMKQHWFSGAQWFESVLTDYDVSSNYGNWTYVAGVGHDPRKDRWFNIEKQAERYDPDGIYQRTWGSSEVKTKN